MKADCFVNITDEPIYIVLQRAPMVMRDHDVLDFCRNKGTQAPRVKNCFMAPVAYSKDGDTNKMKYGVIRGRWGLYRELFMAIYSTLEKRPRTSDPVQELFNYFESYCLHNPTVNGIGTISGIWGYGGKVVLRVSKIGEGPMKKYRVEVARSL